MFNLAFVFIDIHTHQNIESDQNIFNVIVGKDQVPANTMFSLGIHPWYIDNEVEQLNFLNKELLKTNQNFLFIGECGLDKLIDTPLKVQLEIFEQQINISEQFKKPLVIHCVRAFNEVIVLKKQIKPAQEWVIHGFNRKWSIAEIVLNEGISLSFGYTYLDSEIGKQVFRNTPLNKIFLETDEDTMYTIEEVYILAASILSISLEELKNQVKVNLCRITGWKEQNF